MFPFPIVYPISIYFSRLNLPFTNPCDDTHSLTLLTYFLSMI